MFHGIGLTQVNDVNKPVENFESLWSEFDSRYANFELKQINWNKVYEKYRPQVNKNTTNEELYEVCCAMLQELKDGHVRILPGFKDDKLECGPSYACNIQLEFNSEEKYVAFQYVIDKELKKNGFSAPVKNNVAKNTNTNFQYRFSDVYGYLRLDEMTRKNTSGKYQRAIDEAIEALHQKQGLIIDLRFNGGGWDSSAYKLASRFVAEKSSLGHYERTRIKGKNEFAPMKHREIKSGGKKQFTNPIVILTSCYTASAAEVFILLLKGLPNVTIIGNNTEGMFSDIYRFKLPNRWNVTLSNQQFFSMNKENFEGKGFSPDVLVLNGEKDIERQSDPVINAAVTVLKERINSNKI